MCNSNTEWGDVSKVYLAALQGKIAPDQVKQIAKTLLNVITTRERGQNSV